MQCVLVGVVVMGWRFGVRECLCIGIHFFSKYIFVYMCFFQRPLETRRFTPIGLNIRWWGMDSQSPSERTQEPWESCCFCYQSHQHQSPWQQPSPAPRRLLARWALSQKIDKQTPIHLDTVLLDSVGRYRGNTVICTILIWKEHRYSLWIGPKRLTLPQAKPLSASQITFTEHRNNIQLVFLGNTTWFAVLTLLQK